MILPRTLLTWHFMTSNHLVQATLSENVRGFALVFSLPVLGSFYSSRVFELRDLTPAYEFRPNVFIAQQHTRMPVFANESQWYYALDLVIGC